MDPGVSPVSKAARKAAIEAEVARRDRATGVPPHLHVAILTSTSQARDGGRPFMTAEFVQSLGEQQAEEFNPDSSERFSPDSILHEVINIRDEEGDDPSPGGSRALPHSPRPLPELTHEAITAAIESNKPIRLLPNQGDFLPPDAPYADFSEFQGLLIFSARAARALRPLLEPSCRRVPVVCAGHELVGYELLAVEDVLDLANSETQFATDRLHKCPDILFRYTFFTDRLGRRAIFRVPCGSRMLVLQPFVDVARANGLRGFRFQRIWPRTTASPWL
jgi:hypothetical protein